MWIGWAPLTMDDAVSRIAACRTDSNSHPLGAGKLQSLLDNQYGTGDCG